MILKLCSDTQTSHGVMKESIGKPGGLYMINDAAANQPMNWRNKKAGLVECKDTYCKWQINAPYNQNKKQEMTVGPFPGNIGETTFMAFDYKAIDVLCLEKMVLRGSGKEIDILEVRDGDKRRDIDCETESQSETSS